MQKQIDELYKTYLDERLDLFFDKSGGEIVDNPFYDKDSKTKDLNIPLVIIDYDYVWYDQERGVGIVKKSYDKFNLIDSEGNLLCSEWYSQIFDFHDGYAKVSKGRKYNFIDTNGHLLFNEWFDNASSFSEGYIKIEKNKKQLFIDKKGELLFSEEFLEEKEYSIVGDFHEGYVRIEKDREYNYIDKDGNLLSTRWFHDAKDFSEGYAIVVIDGKSNVIDKKGNLVGTKWRDRLMKNNDPHYHPDYCVSFVGDFHDGYAKVYLGCDYYNYINTKGELFVDYISGIRRGFDKATDFSEGYAMVTYRGAPYGYHSNTVYRRVISKGQFEGHVQYRDVGCFHNGLARVCGDNGFNYIKPDGELLSEQWYDKATSFYHGYAVVIINGINYLLDTKGKLKRLPFINGDVKDFPTFIRLDSNYYYMDENGELDSHCYDYVMPFAPGIVTVTVGDYYNLVDLKTGKLLYGSYGNFEYEWFSVISEFHEGYARVIYNGIPNYLDINGKLLFASGLKYDDVGDFKNGCAKVYMRDKKNRNIKTYSFIDKTGKELIPFRQYREMHSNPNFFVVDRKVIPKKIEMGDYIVKRNPLGYQIKNKEDKLLIKYQPIKMIGKRYVLCLNKNDLFMYDRYINKYYEFGTIETTKYDDNFIYNGQDKKIYLIHNGELIEVTDYVKTKLINEEKLHINRMYSILSKNDFFYHSEDKIRELVKQEKEEDKRKREEQTRIEEERRVQELKELDEQERAKMHIEQDESLRQIEAALEKLGQIEKIIGKSQRIRVKELFIVVDDHKEIKPIYLMPGMLSHIDLRDVSFKNVKISGIDFRGCNIELSPQEVYEKDLRGCNFEGLHIDTFMDFRGVDIRGARFSDDKDVRTLDLQSAYFRQAIYDETTTYNGIPFTMIYGECKRKSMR